MNSVALKVPELAESAYTTDQRVPVDGHFTRVDAFRWTMVVTPPRLVAAPRANDPMGFSPERLARGEADVAEGRVRSLGDVLNALRARLLRNGG